MQVILKPVTHPELGEILVKDSLFAIGRYEAPFADYDDHYVARLSRRHARIFEQDGGVYLADIGSLNGTMVNNQRMDTQPVRLQRGDEICFTAQLCYQIEILGAAGNQAAELADSPPVQLILTPVRKNLLEPIVITRFPFLVNKASEVFSRYRDTLPEDVGYISRRHAHIFQKGNNLFVEDLGSTNGTFVAGVRLDEHARQLHDDDLLAFGGDNFVYRAQLIYAEEAQGAPDLETRVQQAMAAEGMDEVTRTTFVTSATSFLDIFCAEDDSADENVESGKGAMSGMDAKTGALQVSGSRWLRWFDTPRALLHAIREPAGEDRSPGSRRIWLGVFAILLGAATWMYFNTSPERNIMKLLETHQYEAAATLAGHYLQAHSDDHEVGELATESTLKLVVPTWIDAVTARDFDRAYKQIALGKRLAGGNPDGQGLLDMLSWATQLEQFVVQRGGPDAPIVLFVDEDRIIELVDWWDADSKSHSRALATIAQYVPDFMDMRAQVFSHVRSLRNQRSLSVVAIERLLDTIRKDLQTNKSGQLNAVLDAFAVKYPHVQGVDKLRADLDKYNLIDADIQEKKWISAWNRVAATGFQTPVFQERIQALNENLLPTPEVVQRYNEAGSDWANGNTDKALASLEGLRNERWGEVAERRLRHDRRVLADYQQLQAARDQPNYESMLLAFFSELDPVSDAWFMATLADDFRIHSSKALNQAEQDLVAARQAWNKYENEGGIGGLQRLESGISPTYRRLAGLLAEAYGDVIRGVRIYRLLKTDYTADWEALYKQILKEVRLQRQSLHELGMVLEPAQMQAKLDLLPVIQNDDPEKHSSGFPK